MGPRGKMVIGAVLAVLGVWWYVPGSNINTLLTPYSTLTNANALIAMLQGGVGLLAVLVGIFVVWIELDEIRLQRELEAREFGEDVSESVSAVASGGEAGDDEAADDVEEEMEETFHCGECGKEFDSERGLKSHAGQKH